MGRAGLKFSTRSSFKGRTRLYLASTSWCIQVVFLFLRALLALTERGNNNIHPHIKVKEMYILNMAKNYYYFLSSLSAPKHLILTKKLSTRCRKPAKLALLLCLLHCFLKMFHIYNIRAVSMWKQGAKIHKNKKTKIKKEHYFC